MKALLINIIIIVSEVAVLTLVEYLLIFLIRPVCPYPICISSPLAYQPKVLNPDFQWFLFSLNSLLSIYTVYAIRNHSKIKTLITGFSILIISSIVIFYILVLRTLS